MTERKKITIVVQRYGAEVLGGSETLARSLAHLLADIYDVEVVTTCAKDYVTWKNEFPAGESMDGPVRVLRFPVDRQRSPLFNTYNALATRLPMTRGMEELWMRMQGPCSSKLRRYIRDSDRRYNLFIFVTYAYATTFYGMQAVADRAVLVPTAHDEPFIHMKMYRELFGSARKIIYLTDEEKAYVDSQFGIGPEIGSVLGMPVNRLAGNPEAFRNKYGIKSDFLLYAGRIDSQKGIPELIDHFRHYKQERKTSLQLVLCGSGPLLVQQTQDILPLGYVPEEDKSGAMNAALATVLPSRYESYSIVAIESMLAGTPILANSDCAVVKGHCEKSSGGLTYGSYEEFRNAVDLLRGDPGLRDRLGMSGKAYASDRYSVEAVRKKYISLLDGLTDEKASPSRQ